MEKIIKNEKNNNLKFKIKSAKKINFENSKKITRHFCHTRVNTSERVVQSGVHNL